jgi:hypothetical protein
VRYICFVAVLLALPLTASAQQTRSEDRQADRARSEQRRSDDRRAETRPPTYNIGSFTLPAIGLPPATSQRTPAWEQRQVPAWERPQTPAWERKQTPAWEQRNQRQPGVNPHQNGNRHRPRQYQPSIVYVLPQYPYFPNSIATAAHYEVTPPPPTAPVVAEPPPPPMGALRLEVEPKESLQIFVDGVYVGTPADLGDELELAPGTRRIELRARGYRTLTFSAEIVDGRSITYRGSLYRDEVVGAPATPPPSAPSPKPVAVPAGSGTMYMIPGCYLGNVSPKTVALPAGCDITKLKTISP